MRSSLGLAVAVLATVYAVDAHADLVPQRVDRFGDGETIVRYGQVHEGVPVIGRGSLERYSSVGRQLWHREDLAATLPSIVPTLSAADAAKVGGSNQANLIFWPTRDRGLRLAYAVIPPAEAILAGAPRVIVDAQTGEILEARDIRVFAEAQVYESNPKKSPDLVTRTLPMKPTGDFLTNDFVEAHNCIDKKTVKTLDVGISFDVHVCDLDQVAKADPKGNFVFGPIDDPANAASKTDAFSEVSIYFHTTKAYTFFRDLQGDPDAQVVTDKPLRAISNLQMPKGLLQGQIATAGDPEKPLEPFQNAFFAPAAGGLGAVFAQLYGFDAGALWFGQGPKRDFSYDGDVVYHEFTHAVVDDTLKLRAWHTDEFGAVDAPGAMNEGLADYFSCAITGDPDVGEYASSDLGSNTGVIRTLKNQDTCANLVGEVHADSTAFSGGLWDARSSLPEADRAKFDKSLYKAMRQSNGQGDVGFEDVIKLFIAQLEEDLPKGATALKTAMTTRRLYLDGKGCERIIEYGSDPVTSADPRIGFMAPGKQSVSVAGIAPGVMQIKALLPEKAKATQIHITFAKRSPAQQNPLGGNAKPFAPTVLVKMGAPIVWDPDSQNGHDADVRKGAPEGDVTLDLPKEANGEAAYVQIASTGDSDGAYNAIEIEFKTADGSTVKPKPSEPDPSATGSSSGAAAPGKTPDQIVTTEESCGISPRRGAFGVGGLLMGLAGVLSVVRRRRR
jgi:hypothetical protein